MTLNNILFKEFELIDFEDKKLYDKAIDFLKEKKISSLSLYFKNSQLASAFIINHAGDIEYLNEDIFFKDLSKAKIIEYFKNHGDVNVVLNEKNNFMVLRVYIDTKKIHLKNGDVMLYATF